MSQLLKERWAKLAGMPQSDRKEVLNESALVQQVITDLVSNFDLVLNSWDAISQMGAEQGLAALFDLIGVDSAPIMGFMPVIGMKNKVWTTLKEFIAGKAAEVDEDGEVTTPAITGQEARNAALEIERDLTLVKKGGSEVDISQAQNVMGGSIRAVGGAGAAKSVEIHIRNRIQSVIGITVATKSAGVGSGEPDVQIPPSEINKILAAPGLSAGLKRFFNAHKARGFALEVKNSEGGTIDVPKNAPCDTDQATDAEVKKEAIKKFKNGVSGEPLDFYYVVTNGAATAAKVYSLESHGTEVDELFWDKKIAKGTIDAYINSKTFSWDPERAGSGGWIGKVDKYDQLKATEWTDVNLESTPAGAAEASAQGLLDQQVKNKYFNPDIKDPERQAKQASGQIPEMMPSAYKTTLQSIAASMEKGHLVAIVPLEEYEVDAQGQITATENEVEFADFEASPKLPDDVPDMEGFAPVSEGAWSNCTQDQIESLFTMVTDSGDQAMGFHANLPKKNKPTNPLGARFVSIGKLTDEDRADSLQVISDDAMSPPEWLVEYIENMPIAYLNAIEILIYKHNEENKNDESKQYTSNEDMEAVRALATANGLNPDWYGTLPDVIWENSFITEMKRRAFNLLRTHRQDSKKPRQIPNSRYSLNKLL